MKFFESIRIAMRALAANKLRSVLTMLGIIIGVGAVIALMSIGRGVQKFVTDRFAGLGSNLLFILPGQLEDGPPQERQNVKLLTIDDANALADPSRLPDVAGVTAEFVGPATLTRGDKNMRIDVHATTVTYPEIRNWSAVIGSYFTQDDIDERGRVAVLGWALPGWRRWLALVGVPMALAGLGVALWQVAAQQGWLPWPPSCTAAELVPLAAAGDLLGAM